MGIFRIYKGEEHGVKIQMVPAFTDYVQASDSCWRDPEFNDPSHPRMLKRFNFHLTVEALGWPANPEKPMTVNSHAVIIEWLKRHPMMPRRVTVWHKYSDDSKSDRPIPVTEWYNGVCVGKEGLGDTCTGKGCFAEDQTTAIKGLFWGTDNLKATYLVQVTEEGILLDLSTQRKDIREFSEENFEKYGVLTPQDPNAHGRLPWRVFDPGREDPWRELSLVDADNLPVTTLGPVMDTTDMTLGNALFILKCVNEKGDLAMTVGQLEAEVDKLRKERDELQHKLDEVKGEV